MSPQQRLMRRVTCAEHGNVVATSKTITAGAFLQGFSAAAVAEKITIPLDTLKVRRQLDPLQQRYKGALHTVRTVYMEEGGAAFYNGLAAGCMRAGCIYACRLGTYEIVLEKVSQLTSCSNTDSVALKLLTALPVTVFSMVIGNPWDVLKVRAQKAPSTAGTKRRFSIHPRIIARIVRNEGVIGGLYAGFAPNMVRNMVIGSSELVAYYQTKQWLIKTMGWQETIGTHCAASGVAGLTAAVLGSPMDTVASRVMQKQVVTSGISTSQYTLSMFQNEGMLAFYKGFGFNWMRLTGFNLALFVSFEQIRNFCGE